MAASPPFTVQATHAALGEMATSWAIVPEASAFDAALSTPADGSKLAAGQGFDVTWPAQPAADYAVVQLFQKASGAYAARYASPASIATDVTKESVPGSAVSMAGQYLLNVDLGQASCALNASKGCAYLLHPATAQLTVQ
jgi:hypothetical protein